MISPGAGWTDLDRSKSWLAGGSDVAELSVSITPRTDAVIVAAVGDVDISNSAELAEAIASAVGEDKGAVVVDVADVGYCDTSGIRALVHGRRLADSHGVSYRVIGASGVVLDALRLTGVWPQLAGGGEPA
jgi:anti-anti-sigma factor